MPRRIGPQPNDGNNIQLDPDASNAPVQEGDFSENPNGQVTVPYNQVFSDYADAANQRARQRLRAARLARCGARLLHVAGAATVSKVPRNTLEKRWIVADVTLEKGISEEELIASDAWVEVIDGEIVPMAPVHIVHQLVAGNLYLSTGDLSSG